MGDPAAGSRQERWAEIVDAGEARMPRERRERPGPRRSGVADGRPAAYGWLSRQLLLLVLGCAVLPLLLLGWGINLHYSRFARERVLASVRGELGHHRRSLQLFLEDRRARLQLLTATHTLEDLADPERLAAVFEAFNRDQWSITDLGVIAGSGQHLAYVGPYDLLDRNYAEAFWFGEVLREGVYVSDMFLGFRNEPHFIIAVAKREGERRWILRATVDTESFRSLVEDVRIGRTGEVYLLNRDGVYQTAPRFRGRIMEPADVAVPPPHEGIAVDVLPAGRDAQGRRLPRRVFSHVWLAEPPWLLVVQQDWREAFDDVNHANRVTLLFIHLTTLAIVVVAVLITRRLMALVRRRDREAQELNRQLVQAGKLAAIGELAAGVAHEINNPLAIVLTERQLLLDELARPRPVDRDLAGKVRAALDQIHAQVQRCRRITQNLLRFSRRSESVLEAVDVNRLLGEIVELVEREAGTGGVTFALDLAADLPPLRSDPSLLQQVFLNLITNAIDALAGLPGGTVTVTTGVEPGRRRLRVSVADTGRGIAPEHRARIFDPFFTTKEAGQGTGLGLSICHGIVEGLGGEIEVDSEPGRGTTFRVVLPHEPPPAPRQRAGAADAPRPAVEEGVR